MAVTRVKSTAIKIISDVDFNERKAVNAADAEASSHLVTFGQLSDFIGSTTQFIRNQNVAAQVASAWLSGTLRADGGVQFANGMVLDGQAQLIGLTGSGNRIVQTGATGMLSAGIAVDAIAKQSSALTAGRVPIVDADGALTDTSLLQWTSPTGNSKNLQLIAPNSLGFVGLRLYDENSDGYLQFIKRSSTQTGNMGLPAGSAEIFTFGIGSAIPALGIRSRGYMAFGINNTEYVRLATSGNLLVRKTTDDGSALQVNGTSTYANTLTMNFGTPNRTVRLTDSSILFSRTADGNYSEGVMGTNNVLTFFSRSNFLFQTNGTNTPFIIRESGGVFQGANAYIEIQPGIIANSTLNGTTASALRVRPTLNLTGTFAGTVRGIYYNPILTSIVGTHHIAFQNTTGDNYFNSTSGNFGIGYADSASLTNKLSVNGTTLLDGATSINGNIIQNTNAFAFGAVIIGSDGEEYLTLSYNGATRYLKLFTSP